MPDRREDLESRRRVVLLEQRYRNFSRSLTAAVAILGVTLAAVSVVLVNQVNEGKQQAAALQQLNIAQTKGRRFNAVQVCDAINGNADAINALNRYIANLVLDQTEQSKPFEDVYRKLGLPPYSERLKQTKKIVRALRKRERDKVDCDALGDRIARGE